MAWVSPVTTWAAMDGIAYTDLNRIEGNTDYLKDNQDAVITLISRIYGLHTHIRKAVGPVYNYSYIAITPGRVAIGSPSIYTAESNSLFTKDITSNWAAGTGNGGFPSGLSLAVDTVYKVFLIVDTDTDTVDFGFDTSATAANLLADATAYDIYIQIGTVRTAASGSAIRYSHDYSTDKTQRIFERSCFPLTVTGYSTALEITAESLHNLKGDFVQLNLPLHGSALTASGSTLKYTCIANNTPNWISGYIDEDAISSGLFYNGAGNNKPGHLRVDASVPEIIAACADGSGNIGESNFTTGGVKGLLYNANYLFHTWKSA